MSAVGCREILTHSLFLISHIKAAFEDTAGERRKERVKLVTLPRDGGLLGGSEAPGLTLGLASIRPSCSHALTHGGMPFDTGVCAQACKTKPVHWFCLCCFGACEKERTVVHAGWKRGNPGFVQEGVHSVYVCNYGHVVQRLYCARENPCLCVRLVCESMFVCGLHMLTITSPICVNHRRRRNRVRHSDYDLKDIRGRGTCDRACKLASLPDQLYSHQPLSVRPSFTLAVQCTAACIPTLLLHTPCTHL